MIVQVQPNSLPGLDRQHRGASSTFRRRSFFVEISTGSAVQSENRNEKGPRRAGKVEGHGARTKESHLRETHHA